MTVLSRIAIWLLGLAAVAALALTARQLAAVDTSRSELTNLAAPRGLLSLTFADRPDRAAGILREWSIRSGDDGHHRLALARETVDRDDWLIAAYVAAGVLVTLWAVVVARPSPWYAVVVILCFAVGGLLDWRENAGLRELIDQAGRVGGGSNSQVEATTVSRIRDAAIGKFILLLLGGAGALIVVGAAFRRLFGSDAGPASTEARSFDRLIADETGGIFAASHDRPADTPVVALHEAADEPRVAFRAADVIGLALSGGGIRSATFNLGLLQGLHCRNLLPMIDYLATVSGGGYVGAFWSAWLARRSPDARGDAHLFPSASPGGHAHFEHVDSPQERHLREFSRFLAPRWGFFELETWTAIVALVAGLVPALAIGLSVIGLTLVGWLTLTLPLALDQSYAPSVIAITLVTAVTMVWFERLWYEVKTESGGAAHLATTATTPRREWVRYGVFAVAAIAMAGVAQAYLPDLYRQVAARAPDAPAWLRIIEPSLAGLERWWVLTGIGGDWWVWRLSPRLLDYSVSWLAVALGFVLVRLVLPLGLVHWTPVTTAAFDRVLTRLLGLGVFWLVLALLWHLIINTPQIAGLVAASLASGAAFAALRNWIGVTLRRSEGTGVGGRLKSYVPALLAYITIVLLAVIVGQLLIRTAGVDWLAWWIATAAMMLVAIVGLFIDPARFGLHAFYRDRLSRAFTGASNLAANQDARHNRGTDPRDGDDRRLAELADRPLHLVCCAANDLSGDTVETLGRGARSAVLSKYGLSVGNHAAPMPDVWLGSAITASAAAFNSNMGMVSLRVGPAVSFLMTTLNLRLGLWVRHPAAPPERWRRWPGLLLYREMFGLTSSSGTLRTHEVPILMRDLHLSDGAHFENLALYELIRRHCRYVIVSDCGSDANVAFDDLGNALRRVREDFGVEIELDVDPLRPAPDTGRSKQHVAVGTIHYSDTDRGILLYIKPSLTGDEPGDILQYKTANAAFPHETTGDQFYDEAQFESYRRLGMHAAEQVFAFVPPNPAVAAAAGGGPASTTAPVTARALTADWVFAEAVHAWGYTPPDLVANILAMTARFGQLEMDLQHQARSSILQEVFPELGWIPLSDGQPRARARPALATGASDLPFFIRLTQVMEDAWMACRLDAYWDHPLNLGWVNLFARWATAPSFRFWWPLLSPMYSPGFRSFIDERFPVPCLHGDSARRTLSGYVPQKGRVERLTNGPGHTPGFTEMWWSQRSTQPRRWENRTVYQNLVPLPRPDGSFTEIQIGLAAVATRATDRAGCDAGWTSHDFFVPPSLWGAGFGWYFLNGLLTALTADRHGTCYVVVKAVPQDAQHRFARDDHRSFMEQYRKIGFRQQDPTRTRDDGGLNHALLEELGFSAGQDTLFRMDLAQWARRRGSASA